MRRFTPWAIFLWLTLACMTAESTSAPSIPAAEELTVIVPYAGQAARPSPTKTPTPTRIISTPASFPSWVGEFSDPILERVKTQRPIFEDDFTPQSFSYKEKLPTGIPTLAGVPTATRTPTPRPNKDYGRESETVIFNKGWFFIVPESKKNPYYAYLEDGALILKLPNGKENKDFWVYSSHLTAKNFVLQFDLEFGETQPQDTFRFQFEQGGAEQFALDLSKNKTWEFHSNAREESGGYEYLSMPRVRVLIIVQDSTCALYLDNTPRGYFENCRADATQKLNQKSATFHILAEPGHSALLKIDNVTLWDLDQDRQK